MTYRNSLFAVLVIACALVASACGSKPQYCTDLTTLQSAVKDLPSEATSGGVSGLQSQISTIQSDADALVSSAKADFPDQTDAVGSSVAQLSESLKGLGSSPSTKDITAIALNASAVVSSVKSFATATDSECK